MIEFVYRSIFKGPFSLTSIDELAGVFYHFCRFGVRNAMNKVVVGDHPVRARSTEYHAALTEITGLGRNQIAEMLYDVFVTFRRISMLAYPTGSKNCRCCTMMHRVVSRMGTGVRGMPPAGHLLGLCQMDQGFFVLFPSPNAAFQIRQWFDE